jgi:2-polyprenyl-6-methoxyphenol hydroxylase-like FAD-dependent oxidoreductase
VSSKSKVSPRGPRDPTIPVEWLEIDVSQGNGQLIETYKSPSTAPIVPGNHHLRTNQMAPLKILICGCGIAGPALAFWLTKLESQFDITIIERFPTLRAGGQQIDIRGQGVTVMKLMGIEAAVRSKVVDEPGMQFVNSAGQRMAYLEANKTGKGKQTQISEFEIMRGDLCQILYNLIDGKVKVVFGTFAASLSQSDDGVTVQFSDGTESVFDLVVGADGQSSRTRRMIFGQDTADTVLSLGAYAAFYNTPKRPDDLPMPTIYHAPKKRMLAVRPNNLHAVQVAFLVVPSPSYSERLAAALNKGVTEQKEAFAEIFKGSGWQSDRLIQRMRDSDNLYAQEICQIRLDSWFRGRIVLLGDAGYCPSPLTGRGTSTALVGAYVLAGELAITCKQGSIEEIGIALRAYETKFRLFVDNVQSITSPAEVQKRFPETQWGIWFLHMATWLVSVIGLDKLINRFSSDDVKGWDMPEYW